MPATSKENIALTQERLAKEYRLTRQLALMLALLVVFPTVSPTTIKARIGRVDTAGLVSRLRRDLRVADEAATIHTVQGFGSYYLDDAARERFARVRVAVPRQVEGVITI